MLEHFDRRVDVSKDAEHRCVAAVADEIGMRAWQQAERRSPTVSEPQVIPDLSALNDARQPREVASGIGGSNVVRVEDEVARLLGPQLLDRGDVGDVIVLECRKVLVQTHHADHGVAIDVPVHPSSDGITRVADHQDVDRRCVQEGISKRAATIACRQRLPVSGADNSRSSARPPKMAMRMQTGSMNRS